MRPYELQPRVVAGGCKQLLPYHDCNYGVSPIPYPYSLADFVATARLQGLLL
jgi:hypothetical protein